MKTFYINDDDNQLEYYIVVEKTKKDFEKYSLFASNGTMWNLNIRNSVLFSIVDNGNEIKIEKQNKKKKSYEYNEAFYLQILLAVNNLLHGQDSKITLFEKDKEEIIISI